MVIKRKKSAAMKFLEDITGSPLSLGKFLQSIRLGEEMSQVEFARQLGISKSHLCDIEKGRKLVSPERAVIFAKILKYSSEQFVRLALQDQVEKAGLKFKVKIEAA
jgi:transcriptional regulator with XRE-family HTH domain